MKVEFDLSSEITGSERGTPEATVVVQPMPQGDMIVGVRPYNAHPDTEYAIVQISVEPDGTIVVQAMDGSGHYIGEAVRVS
jgi:hypothetical protein